MIGIFIHMSNKIDIKKYINNRKREENTVHNNNKKKRFEKAEKQKKLDIVDLNIIINLTNKFINEYGLNLFHADNFDNYIKTKDIELTEFNKNTKKNYKGITSEKDIIWMKFTTDGRIGVVACSNDVNFDIPSKNEDYDEIILSKNGQKKKWKYNSSGILVHSVGLKWDESFFLVFPLLGLKEGKDGNKQRHDLETGIGNYLIDNNVPIIDYYSHRF